MSAREEIASLMLEGRFGEAYRKCDQALRGDSGGGQKSKVASDADFFRIAGAVSLLGLGHIRQAEEWTANVESTDPAFYYIEALIHLHAGRTHEALLCYTRLIDEDPSDTFADRLIEKLRAHPDEIVSEVQETAIGRYLPIKHWFGEDGLIKRKTEEKPVSPPLDRLRARFKSIRFTAKPVRWVMAGSIAFLLLVAAIFLYLKFGNRDHDLAERLPDPPTQGTIIPLSELKKDEVRFTFDSRKEVIDQYELARRKVIDARVNEARVLLNEIDLSNAGFELKERALLLKQMIPYIAPSRFSDNVEIQKVVEDPDLYQGVQVLWPGEIVNEPTGPVLRTAGGKVRLNGSVPSSGTVKVSGFFQRIDRDPVVDVREIVR